LATLLLVELSLERWKEAETLPTEVVTLSDADEAAELAAWAAGSSEARRARAAMRVVWCMARWCGTRNRW
jgi:hypothetical protein